jgi:hypothetical protein
MAKFVRGPWPLLTEDLLTGTYSIERRLRPRTTAVAVRSDSLYGVQKGDHWGAVQPADLATLLRGLTAAAMGHQPDRPSAPNNHSSWHGGVATGPPPAPRSTTLSPPTLPPVTGTPPSAQVHNQHHRRRTAQPARPAPRDPRVRCHASGRRRRPQPAHRRSEVES